MLFVTQAEKTAIVDVKIDEFHYFNIDTMQKHLLSHDLFTEYYEEDKESDTFYITNTTTFAHDTALINSWIRKGELGKRLHRSEVRTAEKFPWRKTGLIQSFFRFHAASLPCKAPSRPHCFADLASHREHRVEGC